MQYDAILTLGAGIDEQGQLGSDGQKSVQLAIQQWQPNKSTALIMSGNYSYKSRYLPPISEAQAMKDYAVSLGVPGELVHTEVESRDTFGNAYFTKLNLLLPLQLRHIIVVAGLHHSPERLNYILRKAFGNAITYRLIAHTEARPDDQPREAKSLEELKELFDDIPDGDDTALYKRLRSRHPAYSRSRHIAVE